MTEHQPTTSLRFIGWIAGALAGLALLGGCQSARVAHPLTAELSGSDPESQLNFWHTLASRPLTSNDEAFHGLLLYTDRQDPAASYAQRVEILRSRGMLPSRFSAPADQAVQRGTLAVAIAKILQVNGGLMMHLTKGRSPRYATKELEFLEVFPPSSPQQTFSGGEFLGIIGRVEDYQRGGAVEQPAAVLPGEAGAATTRPVQ